MALLWVPGFFSLFSLFWVSCLLWVFFRASSLFWPFLGFWTSSGLLGLLPDFSGALPSFPKPSPKPLRSFTDLSQLLKTFLKPLKTFPLKPFQNLSKDLSELLKPSPGWALGPLPSLFSASPFAGASASSRPFLGPRACFGPFVGFEPLPVPRGAFLGLSKPVNLFWVFLGPRVLALLWGSRGLFWSFVGFWTSSQPFLGLAVSSKPFLGPGRVLGLLWASGPLPGPFVRLRGLFLFSLSSLFLKLLNLFPAFSGPRSLFGPFLGFWTSRWASCALFWAFASGPLWAFCGLLSLFQGLGALFWASQPLLGIF